MAHSICPWWLGYLLLSPLRAWRQAPQRILAGLVEPGMHVLDVGCGMGFFTLPLAALVGESGRVVAVDLQPKMLAGMQRRARKRGLTGRIEARRCSEGSLGVAALSGRFALALAFAVVHEVPDAAHLFSEISSALRHGGRLLFAEPRGHVSETDFRASLAVAESSGLTLIASPAIPRSHAALLQKPTLRG